MSTPPSTPAPSEMPINKEPREVKIVSHSHLFYWWPVWAVGFLMCLLTLFNSHRMVVVPDTKDTKICQKVTGNGEAYDKKENKWVPINIANNEAVILSNSQAGGAAVAWPPEMRSMADNPSFGVIFAITLILVILITNVPLRGLWSVVVIITVGLGTIIFALAGWWNFIFEALGHLDIRINMGGYLFISFLLLTIWLITLLFFDRQTYLVFTPGQLKVCTMIGGGEKAYDTMGMTISKQRSDLFRHWILGLGSGDLIVNTVGAHVDQFDWPNVLFIGTKVHKIERMLREKSIVEGR